MAPCVRGGAVSPPWMVLIHMRLFTYQINESYSSSSPTRRYIRSWNNAGGDVTRESTYDTAGSAKLIAAENMVGAAAICSSLAAKLYVNMR